MDIISGSVGIRDSKIGYLVSDGLSRSVKLDNIISQVIELEKTSGSVRIEGIYQVIDINSTSGSIVITLDNMPKQIRTVQTSGNNKIELPENNGFEL